MWMTKINTRGKSLFHSKIKENYFKELPHRAERFLTQKVVFLPSMKIILQNAPVTENLFKLLSMHVRFPFVFSKHFSISLTVELLQIGSFCPKRFSVDKRISSGEIRDGRCIKLAIAVDSSAVVVGIERTQPPALDFLFDDVVPAFVAVMAA